MFEMILTMAVGGAVATVIWKLRKRQRRYSIEVSAQKNPAQSPTHLGERTTKANNARAGEQIPSPSEAKIANREKAEPRIPARKLPSAASMVKEGVRQPRVSPSALLPKGAVQGDLRLAPAPAQASRVLPTQGQLLQSERPQTRPTQHLSTPTSPIAHGLTWIGVGTTVRIDDLHLVDSIGFFTDSHLSPQCEEPAAIDLALKVASGAGEPGKLSYWPKYSDLSSQQRRYYLRWLASGRRSPPAELGYMFLFFYGLERRAIIDKADHILIFEEVMRLRQVYRDAAPEASRSWDAYSLGFLWFLIAAFSNQFMPSHVKRLAEETTGWTDDNLASLQCWFATIDSPLPAWAAYIVAEGLAESQRSVVLRRVGDDFRKLFCKRYAEQFGDGLVLKCSKRERQYSYRAASAVFRTVSVNGLNPAGLRSQYKPLSAIWNECVSKLKKLSSVVGKSGAQALTVAAWEAMPSELRSGVDHPLTDNLCQLLSHASANDGPATVSAENLAKALEVSNGVRLTITQSRRLSEIAGQIGYLLEPDACLVARAYRPDEMLTVLLKTTDEEVDRARYLAANCMLHVAMMVVTADGEARDNELALLTKGIESAFALNETEQRRISALRSLLMVRGADPSVISKLAKVLNAAQREAIGKLAVALVAADGVVTAAERKAIRVCYAKLGFERDEIDRVLSALQKGSAEDPIVVASATPSAPGEAIPPPPPAVQSAGLRLDRAAIAAIMQDTKEVAQMLAAAMAPDEMSSAIESESSKPSAPPNPVASVPEPAILLSMASPAVTQTSDVTLPERYAAFFQILIARGEWDLKEADSAAREHGHMLNGVVETLNEWATDKYGAQLFIEEDGRLVVDKTILN